MNSFEHYWTWEILLEVEIVTLMLFHIVLHICVCVELLSIVWVVSIRNEINRIYIRGVHYELNKAIWTVALNFGPTENEPNEKEIFPQLVIFAAFLRLKYRNKNKISTYSYLCSQHFSYTLQNAYGFIGVPYWVNSFTTIPNVCVYSRVHLHLQHFTHIPFNKIRLKDDVQTDDNDEWWLTLILMDRWSLYVPNEWWADPGSGFARWMTLTDATRSLKGLWKLLNNTIGADEI